MKCYVPSINTIRYVDTVKILTQIPLPSITPEDYLNWSAPDVLSTIQRTPPVVPPLEYGDRTKNALLKIAQLLRKSTRKPTIVLPVVIPTPTLPHISLPVKIHSVTVTSLLPPNPYHSKTVSQLTPPYMAQKEVSTLKPSSSAPSVHNKTTPKTKNKIKNRIPSNDIQKRPFSARILQYISHQCGTNLRAHAADNLVAQHTFQFQTNKIYNHKVKGKQTIT